MKQVSTALAAHLAQDVTTLATCWKITRTDGVVLGFTDHDVDLVFQGITYIAASGYLRSAISNTATTAVDNMEVKGFLDDDSIAENDLRNGVYDFAAVEIFMVNWADLTMGIMRLRYGLFGEVQSYPSGLFVVELRGLIQLLSQTLGEIYVPECRADLGDGRCKINLIPSERTAGAFYSVGTRVVIPISTGEITQAIAIPNSGFETPSGAGPGVTNWHSAVPFLQSGTTLELSPFEGDFFGVPAPNDLTTGAASMAANASIVVGPVTASDIDSSQYELVFSMKTAVQVAGWMSGATVHFYDALGNLILNKNIVIPLTTVIPKSMWKTFSAVGGVPPLARTINVSLQWDRDPYQSNGRPSTCFDAISVTVRKLALDPLDIRRFGGVEFVCAQAGTTASSVLDVSGITVGGSIADGGVVWTMVTPQYAFLGTVATVTDNTVVTLSGISAPDNWFQFGVAKLLSGPNAGRSMEVQSWDNTSGTLIVELPFTFRPAVGDQVMVHAGCDKSREICFSKFNNILNFRGEPDIPGTDMYFAIGRQ